MVIIVNHPAPTEGIHHQENNVTAYFKDRNLGKGTLYIAESILCWINNSGDGFSLEYPSICIHAVSRDLSSFPEECIFLMVEGKINGDSPQDKEEEEEVDDDVEKPTVEFRFVPDNNNMLDVMFRALSDCQVLNPDPTSDEECESFAGFPIFSGNVENDHAHEDLEIEEGDYEVEVGGDGEEPMNEDQFEDADE